MNAVYSAAFLLGAAALLPSVLAHGALVKVAVDGTVYDGAMPGKTPLATSPIRLIADVSPVKGASNKDLACGNGVTGPAAFVAPAKPGSAVSFGWVNGGGGNWPHNTGPVMTYMAACTGTTCDKFDQSQAQWFKIHQAGKQDDGTWYQADIMSGDSFTVSLPSDIASGDYLVRHEIISLQGAGSVGGAEYYPACVQLRVSGSGSGKPASTVPTSGLYTDNDPGIYVPDVYNPGFTYTFPGTAVSNLAAASAAITAPIAQWASSAPSSGSGTTIPAVGAGAAAPSGTAAASASAPAASATGSPGTPGSGSCTLKPGKRSVYARHARAAHRPQYVSRVMRRLLASIESLEAELADIAA